MAVLTETRRRFRVAAAVLAVIAGVSGLYLLLPGGGGSSAKWAELNNRRNEAKTLESQLRPLRDLPKLLDTSRRDIAQFYSTRLPFLYSTVIDELGQLANRSGVTVAGVQYDQLEIPQIPGLNALVMRAAVSGRYINVARFINALETNQDVFFLINGIELSDEEAGRVSLQLHLETYLRPRTNEDLPAGRRSPRRAAAQGESD
jgi:hypothetical protein